MIRTRDAATALAVLGGLMLSLESFLIWRAGRENRRFLRAFNRAPEVLPEDWNPADVARLTAKLKRDR